MGHPLGPRCPCSQAHLMTLSLHLPFHPFQLSPGNTRAYGRRSFPLLSLSWLLDTPGMGLGNILAPHVSLLHSTEDAEKGLLMLSCLGGPWPVRQVGFPRLEVKHPQIHPPSHTLSPLPLVLLDQKWVEDAWWSLCYQHHSPS